MPTFLLAGHNRSLTTQLRKALEVATPRLKGWTWELMAGNTQRKSILGLDQVNQVCARSSELDGAPIFGISEDRRRDEVAKKIYLHFRFRWIDAYLLNATGRGDFEPFINALAVALHEETYWSANVRPANFASPLMLPEVFNPTRQLKEMWRLSRSYNNMGQLTAAADQIDRFVAEHRKKVDGSNSTPWVDRNRWVWEDNGPRHGAPEFPDDWKYSYRIPDGHHFDVVSPNGKKGVFTDAYGARHSMPKGYLNITAHGMVRGM